MGGNGLKDMDGIRRATKFSMAGLRSAWKNESAFRTECVLSLFMIPAGLWIGDTAAQKILLSGSCLMVLMVELLNSAIEAVSDLVSPDYDPLAKRAKDMGSAAVFIGLISTAMVWLTIIGLQF